MAGHVQKRLRQDTEKAPTNPGDAPITKGKKTWPTAGMCRVYRKSTGPAAARPRRERIRDARNDAPHSGASPDPDGLWSGCPHRDRSTLRRRGIAHGARAQRSADAKDASNADTVAPEGQVVEATAGGWPTTQKHPGSHIAAGAFLCCRKIAVREPWKPHCRPVALGGLFLLSQPCVLAGAPGRIRTCGRLLRRQTKNLQQAKITLFYSIKDNTIRLKRPILDLRRLSRGYPKGRLSSPGEPISAQARRD